ncbi:amidase [Sandaracinobacteroides saxicola]|uniref:Amidase n=1 Tax=Sandaracinobacteroides saxicola TaxID=2759707 RepID=A0A7G5IJA8_9SPHN|nr:amidase [Sandaracinobacteroides saxicola]QMW23450.1 amidase [Sandaracinobacteroides saxicola]
MAKIHELGVVRLREAFAAGRVSVVAATEHYLARIAALDGRIGAYTGLDAVGARAAAAESAARFEAGTARALEGVPIAVKGNIDVAGLATHGGIGARRQAIAGADAAVVARLRAAGAVVLGNLNLHEAALGATTNNAFFGATQNPHRPGFTPGGSSGGSGAAVAAGLCAAALGTDTLGSVRIPAAYCGVYGLKPTAGLVNDAGLLFLAERLDTVGPLARSAEDVAAMIEAMAALDGSPPVNRVAMLDSTDAVDMHPAVAAGYALAADLLRGLGCEVTVHHVAIDAHRVRLAGFIEAAREADARFGAAMAADPEGFSPAFKSYLAFGRNIDARGVADGRAVLDAAATEVRGVLQAADAILLPTAPQPAFAHASEAPVSQADFTALANIAGVPAFAMPSGWTSDGLPVGVQLMGRAGGERALLALGGALDRTLNAYRPPIDFA